MKVKNHSFNLHVTGTKKGIPVTKKRRNSDKESRRHHVRCEGGWRCVHSSKNKQLRKSPPSLFVKELPSPLPLRNRETLFLLLVTPQGRFPPPPLPVLCYTPPPGAAGCSTAQCAEAAALLLSPAATHRGTIERIHTLVACAAPPPPPPRMHFSSLLREQASKNKKRVHSR